MPSWSKPSRGRSRSIARTTALVLIDMQRDFLEPGGFGETLGNDVSLLAAAIEPCRARARRAQTPRHAGRAHARRPSSRSFRCAAREDRARDADAAHRRAGPDGSHPGARRARATTSFPRWRRSEGEPVVDKPGKGAFFATDLHELLRNRHIDTLIVGGVTTEVCVHTTVREANDRGYRCIVPGDCCASYFPEFHAVGLAMIKAQGGIFGWVTDSRRAAALALTSKGRATMTTTKPATVDARRLERVLRLRHQHPRQHAGADGPLALRAQDARRPRVRPHPARGRPDDGAVDDVLRVARVPARLEDRPRRRVRAALRHQRAAHVRGRVRDHAADQPHDRRPGQRLGSGARVGVRAELRADAGGFVAPIVRRITPRAALLGTLAGVSIAFISMRPAEEMYMTPVIGIVCFAIILASWFGGVRYWRGIPAGLVAIAAGTAIAWASTAFGVPMGGMSVGNVSQAFANFGFSLAAARDRPRVLRASSSSGIILVTAIPFGIYDLVEAMDNVESAAAAGDSYPTTRVLTADGVVSLVGCLMGNPFINAVYIGHPGWKSMGGRLGYSAATGLMVIVLAWFGIIALVSSLIPVVAISPILLYIGMLIGAQAFQESPKSARARSGARAHAASRRVGQAHDRQCARRRGHDRRRGGPRQARAGRRALPGARDHGRRRDPRRPRAGRDRGVRHRRRHAQGRRRSRSRAPRSRSSASCTARRSASPSRRSWRRAISSSPAMLLACAKIRRSPPAPMQAHVAHGVAD